MTGGETSEVERTRKWKTETLSIASELLKYCRMWSQLMNGILRYNTEINDCEPALNNKIGIVQRKRKQIVEKVMEYNKPAFLRLIDLKNVRPHSM